MSSADNVRENPDGSLRVVDWVFEKTDNDQVHTFLAYAQGTKPKPNNQTGLHNRKMALGYITLRKNTLYDYTCQQEHPSVKACMVNGGDVERWTRTSYRWTWYLKL